MTTLQIDGMTCGHCVMHVRKALAALPGVTTVDVTLQPAEAQVEGDAAPEALVAAVEAEGYAARVV